MSVPSLKPMSVEEYLRTEETSPHKREYVGGYVYPLHGTRGQAGTSRGHMLISQNIFRVLDPVALQKGCLVCTSDMKLKIERLDNFYYPDVMVVCGQNNDDLSATFETAPCLLVEVLSKSTARTDRLAKQVAYTALPSLQTYLIMEQTKRKVYVYQRTGEGWRSSELAGQGGIDLPCLGTALTLDQIYRALPI